jgi:hypothetical protein
MEQGALWAEMIWLCGCQGGFLCGRELGEENGKGLGGKRLTLAVEVVNAHVAEVLDVRAELVYCGAMK